MKRLKILLAAAALLAMTACGSPKEASVPSPVQPAAAETPAAKMLTEAEIRQKYSDAKIKDIKAVGAKHLLVESQAEGAAERFDLYDLETGEADTLPTMPYFVTLSSIVSENCFIFEASGKNSESAISSFPCIFKCFRVKSGTNDDFIRVREQEYYALDRSVQAGSKNDLIISDINITFTGLEVMFRPDGEGSDYYAGGRDIAFTKSTYNSETNQIILEIDAPLPDEGLKKRVELEENEYFSSCAAVTEGETTAVTLTLKDAARGYYIQKGSAGFPYFELRFSGGEVK